MKRYLLILFFISSIASGQGFNHQWLLGSYNFFQDPKGRMLFDSSNYSLLNENRKMVFKGTQANISDANGNLLMSSNGVWIANASGDTMINGENLAPSYLTNSWPYGIPLNYGDVFLPFPNDSNKYVLFHKSRWSQSALTTSALYKSIIDLLKDSVISLNDTLIVDTLSWGVGACKHANGRDWWVFVMTDGNPSAYTILLTPNGIDTIFTQSLNFTTNTYGNVSGIVFSPDGKKMIYSTALNQTVSGAILLCDFDRCTGLFSNTDTIQITNGSYLFGLAFSASSKYAYSCTNDYVFQISTDSLTVDTVAWYDGFYSPGPTCCQTSFWGLYLAANGKIYVTSGSGVQHIHEMNYPDSAGIACDVQQHAISLGYAQLRAVPNHPNYYLGCDTTSSCPCLTTSRNEQHQHDFKFSISPNPSSGNFKIIYLLPQNKHGRFDVFDITGKTVYTQTLPPWSTMQTITLPDIAAGLYNCVITSGEKRVSGKVAVVNP